jgi:hypothetical protein
MFKKLARPFLIKTRFEAFAVIYALAMGAVGRGFHYIAQYPGTGGYLLFAACTGAVFMGGAKILDSTRPTCYRRQSLARAIARARQN